MFTSGTFVVPITIAPDSFAFFMHSASSLEISVSRDLSPKVILFPWTDVDSFVVKGTPKKGFSSKSLLVYSPEI